MSRGVPPVEAVRRLALVYALSVAVGRLPLAAAGEVSIPRRPNTDLLVLGQSEWTAGQRAALRLAVLNREAGTPVAGAQVVGTLTPLAGGAARDLFRAVTETTGSANLSFLVPADAVGECVLLVEAVAGNEQMSVSATVRVVPNRRLSLLTASAQCSPGSRLTVHCYLEDPMAPVLGAPASVVLGLTDAAGARWLQRAFRLSYNRLGSFALPIGENVPAGKYRVTAVAAGMAAAATLEVCETMPGELRSALVIVPPVARPGCPLRGQVTASTEGGAPAPELPVVVRMTTGGATGRELVAWQGKTDQAGCAKFLVWLPELVGKTDFVYVSAAVCDVSGQMHVAAKDLPVERATAPVRVVSPDAPLVAGVPQRLFALGVQGTQTFAAEGAAMAEQPRRWGDESSTGRAATLTLLPSAPGCLVKTGASADSPSAHFEVVASDGLVPWVDHSVKAVGETLGLRLVTGAADRPVPACLDLFRNGRYLMALTMPVADGEGELELELGQELTGLLTLVAYPTPGSRRALDSHNVCVWVRPAAAADAPPSALTGVLGPAGSSLAETPFERLSDADWGLGLLREVVADGPNGAASAEALFSLLPSASPLDLRRDSAVDSRARYRAAGLQWLRAHRFNVVYAAQEFFNRTGRFPPANEALAALLKSQLLKPASALDPWGNRLVLAPRGQSVADFDLRSAGEDGVPDTEDDLGIRCSALDDEVALPLDPVSSPGELHAVENGGWRLPEAVAEAARRVLSNTPGLEALAGARAAWGLECVDGSSAGPRLRDHDGKPGAVAWESSASGAPLHFSQSAAPVPEPFPFPAVWTVGDRLTVPRQEEFPLRLESTHPGCFEVSPEGDHWVVRALSPGTAEIRMQGRAQGVTVLPLEASLVARSGLQIGGDPGGTALPAADAAAARTSLWAPSSAQSLAASVREKCEQWRPGNFLEAVAGAELVAVSSRTGVETAGAVAHAERCLHLILQARAADGGFSVRRGQEPGSVGTALALRALVDLQRSVYVDPAVVVAGAEWLVRAQSSNGYWSPDPAYLTDARWGSLENVNLPATALAAMATAQVASPTTRQALVAARQFVEAHWREGRVAPIQLLCTEALTALGSRAAADARASLTEAVGRLWEAGSDAPEVLPPSLSEGREAVAETLLRTANVLSRTDAGTALRLLSSAAVLAPWEQSPSFAAAALATIEKLAPQMRWDRPADPAGGARWQQDAEGRGWSLSLEPGTTTADPGAPAGNGLRVRLVRTVVPTGTETPRAGGASSVSVTCARQGQLFRVEVRLPAESAFPSCSRQVRFLTPPGTKLVATNLQKLQASGVVRSASCAGAEVLCVVDASAEASASPLVFWLQPRAEGQVWLRPVVVASLWGATTVSEATLLAPLFFGAPRP